MIDSHILPAAEMEYKSAVDWYLAKSQTAAERFVAEVEVAIASICEYPDRYPHWDDQYRFYILNKFPYFVAYRQTREMVVIVAVRHTSQHPDEWRGR